MQRFLSKIKRHLEEKEYNKLYPARSKPGLSYGSTKPHKLQKREELEVLTVRPIIFNIGAATYEKTNYLNTSLTQLAKSQNNILNTDDLIQKIKSERTPEA